MRNMIKSEKEAHARAQMKEIGRRYELVKAAVAAVRQIKGWSMEVPGQYWAVRFTALERLRECAKLTREQTFDWQNFKVKWDEKMTAAHKAKWG